MSKTNIGRLTLLLNAILWGSGFVFMSKAIDKLEPYNVLALRFLIASLVLYILQFRAINKHFKDSLKPGIVIGVFLFLGFAFQTIGLQYTTASMNAFLTAVNVIFVPIILYVGYKKRVDNYTIVGAVIMIMGIGFLSINDGFSLNYGDLLTIICSLFFALHIVFVSENVTADNLYSLVFIQIFTTFILSLIFTFVFETPTIQLEQSQWATIIYLAVFATALTFFLQNFGMQYVSSSEGAIILSTEALFGTMFSVLLLGEVLTKYMLVGFALMFFAIVLVESKPSIFKVRK